MMRVYAALNRRHLIALPILIALFALGACSTSPRSGRYFEDDGPGGKAPDVDNIPDAVPKSEPLAARGNKPYSVYGVQYVPLADARGYRERGVASWYGTKFHGKLTSSGEPYDMYAMTAAHKTLPLPSYLRVRNLQNGRSVIVRVNDRGPFLHNRLIDLSYAAATKLGVAATGTGIVEIEAIDPDQPIPAPATVTTATRTVDVISTAQAANDNSARLFVQAGAFRDWGNATALRTRLERSALGPVVIQPSQPGANDTIYRVRIGPVTNVTEGDRIADALARDGVVDAVIVVE
jgi:rare lipoprotein A